MSAIFNVADDIMIIQPRYRYVKAVYSADAPVDIYIRAYGNKFYN